MTFEMYKSCGCKSYEDCDCETMPAIKFEIGQSVAVYSKFRRNKLMYGIIECEKFNGGQGGFYTIKFRNGQTAVRCVFDIQSV